MPNPLSHLTHRELLANRAMARRAVSRGRNKGKSRAMVAQIEAELGRRRMLRADTIYSSLPPLPVMDGKNR